MIYIKKNKEESMWCKFSEDVSFLIRPLTANILEKIKKPFIKKSFQLNKNNEMEAVETIVDQDLYNDAFIDYLIEDWKGVVDEDDNSVDCKLLNKKEVMDLADVFNFVSEMAKKIPGCSAKKLEKELGN